MNTKSILAVAAALAVATYYFKTRKDPALDFISIHKAEKGTYVTTLEKSRPLPESSSPSLPLVGSNSKLLKSPPAPEIDPNSEQESAPALVDIRNNEEKSLHELQHAKAPVTSSQ